MMEPKFKRVCDQPDMAIMINDFVAELSTAVY